MARALWAGGLCGLLSVGCSGSTSPGGTGGAIGASEDGGTSVGSATGGTARSLTGTWDLTTTPIGGSGAVTTTVTIGQDSLVVTSPDFSLTATRTGNALAFIDEQEVGNPDNDVTLTATQTAASFNAGILPFDLGGSWTMQIVPAGETTVMACTLTVSATEIDGACQMVTSDGFDFSFTTKKMTSAASSLGDFGGTWQNTWMSGGTYPCELDFAGNTITTCPGGPTNGELTGSPLPGIAFTYDGANTVSGVAQGWAEYSATRQ